MSEGKSSEQESSTADGPENEGAGQSVDELVAALDASRAAAEQAREQALRAQAEAENVKRRAQRDVENAHKFALERFANDLLPVVDSLERAVASARALGSDGSAAAIADGVDLSLKLFIDTLARADLIQIDPAGEPFNPKFHQAVGMVESDRAEPNSILQVLQMGYTLNGRLVRPAMVIVAKAPVGKPTGSND
jgi:molecular chaperone GrpE